MKEQERNIKNWNQFSNNDKYTIDDILDKITNLGIDSLTFYEKKILENPDIQKKLFYQYNMSLNKVIELMHKFGIKNIDDIYIDKTFYIDGEIIVGEYDEDKFNDVINKVGVDNFIYLDRFKKIFNKEIDKEKLKLGYMGEMTYTDIVIEKIKTYPISLNFLNNRTELVFYNEIDDEIIELSNLENGFGFSSADDALNYIKILNRFLPDNEIIKLVKKEIFNIKVNNKKHFIIGN